MEIDLHFRDGEYHIISTAIVGVILISRRSSRSTVVSN